MPSTTPAAKRRLSSRLAPLLPLPDHLPKGTRILVPRTVFPKERVPPGFKGWEARVTGVDPDQDTDGQHILVKFEDTSVYHFPLQDVESWVISGRRSRSGDSGEGLGSGAAPARRSARKVSAASSSRRGEGGSPGARRSLAHLPGVAEEQQRQEAGQPPGDDAPAGRQGGAATPARRCSIGEAQGGASARKRKAEDGADSTPRRRRAAVQAERGERAGQARAHSDAEEEEAEAEAEASWMDTAAGVLKESALTTAAVGICYGLLSTLF